MKQLFGHVLLTIFTDHDAHHGDCGISCHPDYLSDKQTQEVMRSLQDLVQKVVVSNRGLLSHEELRQHLLTAVPDAKIDERVSQELIQMWEESAPHVKSRFNKSHSHPSPENPLNTFNPQSSSASTIEMMTPHVVKDVSWKLKVISGQRDASFLKEPVVQMDFSIYHDQLRHLQHLNHDDKKITLEFNQESLKNLYTELEKIQTKLDHVSQS